ncbi:MAG: DUF4349 domain-containing protein [Flavobacteriaceae bacterium]
MKTNKSKSLIKTLGITIFTLFIAACNSEPSKMNVAMKEVAVSDDFQVVEGTNKTLNNPLQNVKIIKTAEVRYKVKNVTSATKKISAIVKQANGYIADQRFQNTKHQIENRFTVKIPQKEFSKLLDSIEIVAEFIDYQNITSEDVTEKYIDLQSRLRTKMEIKQRYENILRKKTGSIQDILEAEEKIGAIQEEIEAATGKLHYLTNRIAYSTIKVDLYETVNYKEEPESYSRSFLSKTKEGLSFGWNLIETIFLGLIYGWPFILLGTVLFVALKRKNRK